MSGSLVVTTTISVTVSTIIGAMFKWGGDLIGRIRTRLAPDHGPLHAGQWSLVSSSSNSPRIRILVACAPSRSLRQAEIDPGEAIRFGHQQLGDRLPGEPVFSTPGTGVRFEPEGSDSDKPYMWVWTCGRLDYCVFITPETEHGLTVLPLLGVVRPIIDLAQAAASHDYTKIFPRRLIQLPRRLDWFVAVSTSIVAPDNITKPWEDLDFPGARPPRAGGNQQPFCPPVGYAQSALTSWNPRRPVTELLAKFLDSFLKENGFHDCDPAIADTIRAVETGGNR